MMHTCTGCNTLTIGPRVWHGAFRRSLAARDAGRRVRAALWGRLADTIVRWS